MSHRTESPPHKQEGRRLVLCVEDSEFVHQIYRVAFRRLRGWEATHVYNGAEGLEAAERLRPHFIIVDINMPVMDGLRFLDQLSSRWAGPIPHVLVASTEGSDAQIRDALRRGAKSFLKKPFTLDEFLQLLERIAPTLPPPLPVTTSEPTS